MGCFVGLFFLCMPQAVSVLRPCVKVMDSLQKREHFEWFSARYICTRYWLIKRSVSRNIHLWDYRCTFLDVIDYNR